MSSRFLRPLETGDAALVHVNIVREPDENPGVSGAPPRRRLKRFRAKWMPVRVKKTRQNKKLEPGSDPIRTERLRAWNSEIRQLPLSMKFISIQMNNPA